MVERWTRATGEEQYIGNGALIAAAIGLGLNYAPSGPRSPNIRLGISERRLKIVLEEAGHPLQAK
jgi:hypothetical protein